jgi:hypothetical protein
MANTSGTFRKTLNTLEKIRFDFTDEGINQQLLVLKNLGKCKLSADRYLVSYINKLLFICAHPANKIHKAKAEQELLRIAMFLNKNKNTLPKLFLNSGLPFSKFITQFSHDCLTWLMHHPDCSVGFHTYVDAHFDLNEVFKLTLPSVECSETTAGLTNNDLVEALGIKKEKQLDFILNELSRFNDQPFVKDHLFDGLGIQTEIIPKNKTYSLAYNRFSTGNIFYQKELLKKFNHVELLNESLPQAFKLSKKRKQAVIQVVKNTMALTNRETDPVSYLHENSLRLYNLQRGISVAIYGMTANRQLPFESYMGYTLFKNGFPAAYGGGWVFGTRSDFGINIFDWFRGGESGYMMCELLRVYRQLFGITYFEVEPYQYGLDNPDGIKSGAFWFYYRYGFRPLDKTLRKLADEEHKKIHSKNEYRSSEKTLVRFTESNMVLQLAKETPTHVADVTSLISKMVQQQFKGDRIAAEKESVKYFCSKTNFKALKCAEQKILCEFALWASALKIKSRKELLFYSKLISAKTINEYHYQHLLKKII